MGGLFSRPKVPSRQPDPELERQKREAAAKAEEERKRLQAEEEEEANQRAAGNRGFRSFFSGGVQGFDTLNPGGFFTLVN